MDFYVIMTILAIVDTHGNLTALKKVINRAKKKDIDVRKIRLIAGINATEIRKRILHGNDWRELVPKEVAEYVEKVKGIDRIKEIN